MKFDDMPRRQQITLTVIGALGAMFIVAVAIGGSTDWHNTPEGLAIKQALQACDGDMGCEARYMKSGPMRSARYYEIASPAVLALAKELQACQGDSNCEDREIRADASEREAHLRFICRANESCKSDPKWRRMTLQKLRIERSVQEANKARDDFYNKPLGILTEDDLRYLNTH